MRMITYARLDDSKASINKGAPGAHRYINYLVSSTGLSTWDYGNEATDGKMG